MNFKEYLQEGKKLTITLSWGPMADAYTTEISNWSKKFNLVFGKPLKSKSGSPEIFQDITGSKENIIKFLIKEYGFDQSEISKVYPNL